MNIFTQKLQSSHCQEATLLCFRSRSSFVNSPQLYQPTRVVARKRRHVRLLQEEHQQQWLTSSIPVSLSSECCLTNMMQILKQWGKRRHLAKYRRSVRSSQEAAAMSLQMECYHLEPTSQNTPRTGRGTASTLFMRSWNSPYQHFEGKSGPKTSFSCVFCHTFVLGPVWRVLIWTLHLLMLFICFASSV